MAETAVVKPCSGSKCVGQSAQYQDKLYGKGMRIHNLADKGHYTCTVCGNVVGGSGKK